MRILNVDRNWIINWFKRPEAIDQVKQENIRFISINGFSGAFEEENFDGTQKSPIPQELIDNGQALPLNFDDATKEDVKKLGINFFLFTFGQAQMIKEFIEQAIKANVKTLIVHCSAGISRSSAVSITLNEFINQNNLEDFRINQAEGFLHSPVPNQRVRKVLKEVLGLNPENS